MPDSEVRAACTGLVDFYFWKGVPVARRWPRFKPREPSAAEAASQSRFSVVATATGNIGTPVKEAWQALGTTTGTTWVDMFRNNALGGTWVSRDG
jgi:hypothetical protein